MNASDRYVELNKRMNAVNGAGAGAITLLTMLATWGRWRAFALIAVTQLAIILFNTLLVNNILLRRWGVRRGEVFRVAVNTASGLFVNHIAHWPIASWLILPYVALVFDHLGTTTARNVTVATCLAQSAFALCDGVPWIIPLAFTVFAACCSAISHVRFQVIRDMLVDADAQRVRLEQAIQAREQAEQELRQSQKLEAIGRLAAGVAHEINTPLQYVTNTTQFLAESCTEVLAVLSDEAAEETVDMEFLRVEVPNASKLVLEGLGRVADIVSSLKDLANPERAEMTPLDLNRAVHNALTLAQHEYRFIADVHTELADIPVVLCHTGPIQQVLVNLVVNAAHAIASTGTKGNIRVRTAREGDCVAVFVEDDGPGIPAAIREKIFEPFFTTKPVGQGTGQGLAIARAIVVDRHRGRLTFESASGKGTCFCMRLPLASATQSKAA